ncbi:hypothetical protein RHMOL_Rhmol04G0254700 [Rhododendron molle]|uniref:Uncharacterized protein n=1 Tax=Rhododendron molle TaxID=49168 RepID=A0ACC0P454_RHOML|nr:hypothetical protein RHMOL_Rhmol04G0254700 [Rhododendron molle]
MKRLQPSTPTSSHFSNLFSYYSKLLNTTESMEEERIETTMSNLPPEILRQIVSLIPLKEAVRTSTLSTSWKTLWTPFQVEFDSDPNQITSHTDDEASKKINQIVGLLSKSCSSPELWRFSLQMEKTQKPLFFSAAKGGGGGGGEELHLDFFEKGKTIQSNFNLVYDPTPGISNFSSIKTLHLVSVNIIANNLVSTLFSSCRFLESLKLEKCSGIQSIDIKASDSLNSFEVVGCEEVESIAISAPNLKSLWYRGALPLIQINGCLNLVDVVLDLREGFGRSEFDCEDVLNLLSSLKDVEILKISGWLLETDQNLSSITCPYFHQFWHEPHLWMDYETVTSNVCQLQHLKLIQLEGFANEEDDQLMMLMDLLLRKSIALKSMTVISPEKQSRRVMKIPKSQLNHTSACSPKRLVLCSPYEDYFFGLIEDENSFHWS